MLSNEKARVYIGCQGPWPLMQVQRIEFFPHLVDAKPKLSGFKSVLPCQAREPHKATYYQFLRWNLWLSDHYEVEKWWRWRALLAQHLISWPDRSTWNCRLPAEKAFGLLVDVYCKSYCKILLIASIPISLTSNIGRLPEVRIKRNRESAQQFESPPYTPCSTCPSIK